MKMFDDVASLAAPKIELPAKTRRRRASVSDEPANAAPMPVEHRPDTTSTISGHVHHAEGSRARAPSRARPRMRLAMERHDQQTPRIERRQQRRQHGAGEPIGADPRNARQPGRLDDRVLRIRTPRKAGCPPARDCRSTSWRRSTRISHPPDAAHAPHVLLARHRVDHAEPARQEQQRLEERVREQMEDADASYAPTPEATNM